MVAVDRVRVVHGKEQLLAEDRLRLVGWNLDPEVARATEGQRLLVKTFTELDRVLLDVRGILVGQTGSTPDEAQVALTIRVLKGLQNFPEAFDNLMTGTAVLVLRHLFEPGHVDLGRADDLFF